MSRATDEFCRAKINVLPGQNRATVDQKVRFCSQNTVYSIYKLLIIKHIKKHNPVIHKKGGPVAQLVVAFF